jgi:hypothetical protein
MSRGLEGMGKAHRSRRTRRTDGSPDGEADEGGKGLRTCGS